MNIVPVSKEALEEAVRILREGGVVAHATETCYGLACDLRNPAAVAKLFAIKQRPDNQPVSALFVSLEEAQTFLEWNEIAAQLAANHLPGPLTVILKQRHDAPCILHPKPNADPDATIGMRISPHPTAVALVRMFGAPLSTTSANVHGKPNPYSTEDLRMQFGDRNSTPDMILDDGTLEENDASTVVDVSAGTLHVLRKGSLEL